MKNYLKEMLTEAGYSFDKDNRDYMVRSLNGLIDAGILELQFISKERVNEGYRYHYTAVDGKRRGTGYRIRLYGGKWRAGHWMPTSNSYRMMGEVFAQKINYVGIDILSLATRVASLMETGKKEFDIYRESYARCAYCDGTGRKPQYSHICKGVCFQCGGTGIDMAALKSIVTSTLNGKAD